MDLPQPQAHRACRQDHESWEECDGGVEVAWYDVSPNTEHGASNAALAAHILYENDAILNTPSLAWHFVRMFWK